MGVVNQALKNCLCHKVKSRKLWMLTMASPDAGALDLVSTDMVSEMKSEMCGAIARLVRDTSQNLRGVRLERSSGQQDVCKKDC